MNFHYLANIEGLFSIVSLLRSQPRVDAFVLFVLGVLWLTMAAWTVDMVGGIQCAMLGSQTIEAKNGNSCGASFHFSILLLWPTSTIN